jgi:hypothetical protein
MTTRIITISNDFHDTQTTARVRVYRSPTSGELYGKLSHAQVVRIGRDLCGVPGCTCSPTFGARGPQEGWVDWDSSLNGGVEVVLPD